MTVFIAGGTGFVGRAILRELAVRGHRARLLVRDPDMARARTAALPGEREFRRGDVLDASSLPAALAGADAVIHLVGVISEIGRQTYENVHMGGTENLVAAAKAVGVRRFVHMSALGTRANAVARYHKSKWAAEECVRASGLDWTIFRPSIIYGPGDGFVNLFARMSRWSPVLPVMGSGKNLLQPIAVEDVARCFARALAEPRSVGQTIDLCGDERFAFVEILEAILRATGRRRLKLKIPMPVARLQAALLEFVFPTLLRQPSPLNRDQLLMLQEDNVGDPEPAKQMFAFTPRKFRDGIAAFLSRQHSA